MSLPVQHRVLNRRQACWLVTGALSSLTLHACTHTAETPVTENLSVSIGIQNWIGYTPLFIAQEKGFFKQRGLELDVKIFGSNTESTVAFVAGQLDAVGPVTSEAVIIADKGKDYRVVLVEDMSVGGDGILARNSVTDIKAFKGQKIAVDQGGVSHFFLLQVLKEVGLNESDVSIVSTPPDAAATAYQTGKIDIAVTYAPFLQKANQAQKDGRIIYDSSKMPTAIIDLYIFDTKFIQSNPKAVQAFVDGVLSGLVFLKQNPTESVAIAAKRLNVKPGELAADLKGIQLPDAKSNIEMLSDSQSQLYLLNSMNALAKFLVGQKKIQKVPDLSNILEPHFVKNSKV